MTRRRTARPDDQHPLDAILTSLAQAAAREDHARAAQIAPPLGIEGPVKRSEPDIRPRLESLARRI